MSRLLGAVLAKGAKPLDEMSEAELTGFREKQNAARTAKASRPLTGAPHRGVRIEDRVLCWAEGDAYRVRVYTPLERASERLGLVAHFHGGGFVLGTPAQTDWHSSGIAALTPAIVISVDYPLAPEHRFPAAIEYSWGAVCQLVEHADELGAESGRVALVGDSAGGTIAAVLATRARDHGMPISLQVLIYPACDATDQMDAYPSASENRDAPILPMRSVHGFVNAYLRPEDAAHPDASPIRRQDLGRLAPALIQTAQFDPLRDQARAYGERLREAGNNVVVTNYSRAVHGYVGLPGITRDARTARHEVVTELRRSFAGPLAETGQSAGQAVVSSA